MIELQLNMHSLLPVYIWATTNQKIILLSILFLTKKFILFVIPCFFLLFFFSFFSLFPVVSGKRKVSLRYTLKWPADRTAALTAAGIHIHDGLDCTTADGGAHFYDNAKVPDPWGAGTSGNWIASGSAGNWVSFR